MGRTPWCISYGARSWTATRPGPYAFGQLRVPVTVLSMMKQPTLVFGTRVSWRGNARRGTPRRPGSYSFRYLRGPVAVLSWVKQPALVFGTCGKARRGAARRGTPRRPGSYAFRYLRGPVAVLSWVKHPTLGFGTRRTPRRGTARRGTPRRDVVKPRDATARCGEAAAARGGPPLGGAYPTLVYVRCPPRRPGLGLDLKRHRAPRPPGFEFEFEAPPRPTAARV